MDVLIVRMHLSVELQIASEISKYSPHRILVSIPRFGRFVSGQAQQEGCNCQGWPGCRADSKGHEGRARAARQALVRQHTRCGAGGAAGLSRASGEDDCRSVRRAPPPAQAADGTACEWRHQEGPRRPIASRELFVRVWPEAAAKE
eukprot:6184066-Pleurochrysis_carterae.AAC.1